MPRIITETLRYDFTEKELKSIGKELALNTAELRKLELEKKSVTSTYASKINGVSAAINVQSDCINNGYEYRSVECTVQLHDPVNGQKTIYRNDNGAVERIEDM